MSKYELVERATGRIIQRGEVVDVGWENRKGECFMKYERILEYGTTLVGTNESSVVNMYYLFNPDYQIVTVPQEKVNNESV